MEAKWHEVDTSKLSVVELQFEISKCTRLKNALGNRLPDGGERLVKYLDKLNRILAEQTQAACSPLIPNSVAQSNLNCCRLTPRQSDSVDGPAEPSDITEVDTNEQRELHQNYVDDLSERIGSLIIRSESHANSTNSETGCIATLSTQELTQIRYTLNLPAPLLSSIQWFICLLRFSGKLVYLVVFDSQSSDRYLFRAGLRAIWFPGSSTDKSTQQPNQLGDSSPVAQLCSPAEALRDLWHFIASSDRETKPSTTQSTVPCLICCSHGDQTTPNQLVWLSRLLRTTRHSSMARSSMPRDCRFMDVGSLLKSTFSCTEDSNFKMELINECRSISQKLFALDGQHLKPRNFSTLREFFRAGKVRSLPWMEAPLELHILRQLKASASMLSEAPELQPSTSGRPKLSAVPDPILHRLASVGLGRTRLTRLAGLYGWRGFSGLLSFKLLTNDSSEGAVQPFVTDNLNILQCLYRFFRHVYDNLDRHLRLHMDRQELHFKRDVSGVEPFGYSATSASNEASASGKLLAWTAGGNAMFDPAGDRQSRCLDMDHSIALMQKIQKQYQEARVKHSLPSYPTLPNSSSKLGSFRESHVQHLLSDDSSDDSDTDSSSEHSQSSLGLEDVD